MPSIQFLTIEMHLVQTTELAADAFEDAAACRWWQPLKRALLVRKARAHDREAKVWAAQLRAELAPSVPKGAP